MKLQKYLFPLLLLNFVASSFAQECPSDMVLWRQPGTLYSDCVCPTGQSMVTDLRNSYTQVFGSCSNIYIPSSKTWASDVDTSLIHWLDATDPYNSGYQESSNTVNIVDKASNSVVGNSNYQYNVQAGYSGGINAFLFNTSTGINYVSSDVPTQITFFIVVEVLSGTGDNVVDIINNGATYNLGYQSSPYKFYLKATGSTALAPLYASENAVGQKNLVIVYADPTSSSNVYLAVLNSAVTSLPSQSSPYSSSASYVAKSFQTISSGTSTSNNTLQINYPKNFSMIVNEVLVYSQLLSDTEINQLIQILNQKWQIF